jgi:hypothetical protein
MAIQIGNQGSITASTNIIIDSAKQPTFNFIFNQQWASSDATVNSIGGFTSTPSFTPTSNAFTFNSIGSPTGTTTFSFTMTSTVASTIYTDLIKNGVTLETLLFQIVDGYTFIFTPILVSQNDTIRIITYVSD